MEFEKAQFVQAENMDQINTIDIERFHYSKQLKAIEIIMRSGKSEILLSDAKIRSQLKPYQLNALAKKHANDTEYILNLFLNRRFPRMMSSDSNTIITQELILIPIMACIETDKDILERSD